MSEQWTAQFISPDDEFHGAPLLRKEFTLDTGHGDVVSAHLYLSALGVCEAWINGSPVSDAVLTPGWTSYEWRIRYAEIDVTALIDETSVLGIALGNGWYRGRLAWKGGSQFYGNELGAFAQLHIRFADGHEQALVTDSSWQAGPSGTTANDLYNGQSIDARLRPSGWSRPTFDSSSWVGVHVLPTDTSLLQPYVGPAVTRQSEVLPERIWTSPQGNTLVDFGQNLVGWVRVRVAGPAGHVITLRHAEVLEGDELGTRPLRSADATDHFTLSGQQDEFEPTLTFHGFRYLQVDNWPGGVEAISDGALTAVVVSSDLRRTGYFSCSDPLLNQLHENVVWGMRGNFLDVPTDCPQRDERLGWTGDIAAFAPTAAYLFDTKDFLRDWLIDVGLEQDHHNGVVPFVVPDVLKYVGIPQMFSPFESTAIWSDAAVWVPWALWEAYGDPTVFEAQWSSMTGHVRHVTDLLSPNGVWDQGFQFGDWLDPDAPPHDAARAKADPSVVATACLYRSARIVADAAALLGKHEEHAEFEAIADKTRVAFNTEYVHNGVITSDCTTVYALAIVFDLLDEEDRSAAGQRLAALVAESDFRISTGFAGTPFITDALSGTGHTDHAYRLLLQQQCPSWLYPVTMGATTVWERWDSMLPDGTINPGEMTSFNHYALGAVASWMHRVVGGLAPLEAGYRRILIAPEPGSELDWAESQLDTPFGLASVRWQRSAQGIELDAVVPAGASALLRWQGRDDQDLPAGTHHILLTDSAKG